MTQGNCPSCGAAVEFTAGSAQVLVCGHCQTVVAKKGLDLEAHGKIGAIVDTYSPLRLHVEGRVDGEGYRVVGHLQKDHGEGLWDEWYVEFDSGRTAWLSEAEGAWYLLFAEGSAADLQLKELVPGHRFRFKEYRLREHQLVVEERGYGRVVAAEGQLPQDLDPSVDSHYVDATSARGLFVTLDFGQWGSNPDIFMGRKLKLEELGIPPDQLRPKVKKVALQQARCTQCNGPLELRAPDQSKRVACPYCGALLHVRKGGSLAFLQLLEKPDHPFRLSLGAKGILDDTPWIIIGMMVRSCTVEGVRYPWDEYLLYNPERGFTWLMDSNGHWVFLTPLEAGLVSVAPGVAAHMMGKRYRAFQRVTAVTETVLGEFYWTVTAGETATTEEYVAPPHSVNVEGTGKEVTYTRGEYLAPEVVREAFKLKEPLPEPQGIAPSQPNPHPSPATWSWALVWGAVLLAVYLGVNILAANEKVLDKVVRLSPDARSGTATAVWFSEPFEIRKRGNVRVELSAAVNNGWFGLEGELLNQENGEVIGFYEEVGFYSGSDSDGSWSEGSQSETEFLSSVSPGRYVLRAQASFDRRPDAYRIGLVSDTPRFLWFFWGLVLLALVPVLSLFRASSFESARWSESNLGSDS
ncbi:DUF4178 domain-containing protein [Melittangium boletus]|uniref:DUF4178 domain-containing protein n=1 Tax=Melittangium boletus DSM 14713 TaxID=1294270 RepID=A0A250IJ05_9BACT|nr:DUF4178 domain-containing protein [Melittangium boletus]ATB31203.1 hypothetical protein MEBOL_004665 [Melittangium boletus DSM 14713]